MAFHLERFRRDRSGNVAVIAALVCMPIILVAGGGVDLARHEQERVRLQDALDAGLVAAAALAQPDSAEVTVRGYIKAARISDYELQIKEERTVVSRKVTATVTRNIPTIFMKLARISELTVIAAGEAQESYRNMEVSFVLDLSGSMAGSRINAMKPAAKNFIAQLLEGKAKDFTTISLIPYAGQVSVGFNAFDAFAGSKTYRLHDKSSCFGVLETKYTMPPPDFSKAEHVPQFSTWLKGANKGFDPWNCPTEETSISYISNDVKLLQGKIDAYHMFDGTATQIAMKWGLHLLDPAFKPILKKVRDNGVQLVSSTFEERPADFSDKGTLKIIVLMTDGEVVGQFRPKSGLPVNEQPTEGGTNPEKLSASTNFSNMTAACAAAKSRGVVVYTIGFETAKSGTIHDKLLDCATSPSHYFEAKTSDISKIFDSVARSISPLRLTN